MLNLVNRYIGYKTLNYNIKAGSAVTARFFIPAKIIALYYLFFRDIYLFIFKLVNSQIFEPGSPGLQQQFNYLSDSASASGIIGSIICYIFGLFSTIFNRTAQS